MHKGKKAVIDNFQRQMKASQSPNLKAEHKTYLFSSISSSSRVASDS